ncbi:MAG: hypothetical protein JW885_13575 [Deltaproteobacteria bacterium]|nr:hypothetical protein [Candidatus Zymogenaceae bacterium]
MFQKIEIESKLVPAGKSKAKRIKTEIRIDPLTGRTSRITASRGNDTLIDFNNPPYREHVRSSEKGCPFCYDMLEKQTPTFPKEITPEGRFTYNNSVLFPNLNPYGRYSAVATFSPAHFIEIGSFEPNVYVDAFINSVSYLSAVFNHDEEVTASAVTQNYLPSSGGTLIHPHLQINAFVNPTNYLKELEISSKNYFINESSSYWTRLIETETERDERLIAVRNGFIWLTPFAPRGFLEVWAVSFDQADIRDVQKNGLLELARGIIAVQKYYRSRGKNSFNLAVYSIPKASLSYRLLVRMVARANYVPYERNDRSYFEVMLGEAATDESPEKIAQDVKKFFQEG